jgi:DNA-binding PadR family transcriptional regulator
MEEKIKRVYIPMTETGFYILYCLQVEMHGYSIGQIVKEMTDGEIIISPGTMYGSLSKMEKDGLIRFVREEDKRKRYIITDLGQEILDLELKRIERLYRNSKGGIYSWQINRPSENGNLFISLSFVQRKPGYPSCTSRVGSFKASIRSAFTTPLKPASLRTGSTSWTLRRTV